MKRDDIGSLTAQLTHIKDSLDVFRCPQSKAAFLRTLDGLVARLNVIRDQLTDPKFEAKLSKAGEPLEEVIRFLERAKTDDVLSVALNNAFQVISTRPKRVPIEILPNLKNDQIRALLEQDLSKQELKAIAAQRGISPGKASSEELKRDIWRALDRQDGYERLASARAS